MNNDIKKIVMVFSGQGPQNIAMGRGLYERFPHFRNTIKGLDLLYQSKTGISLIEDIGLFGPKIGTEENLNLPQYTIISLAFIQLGLLELLRYYEVFPDVVVGHSLGELAMLHASGQLTLVEAARIAIARSESFKHSTSIGSMIAVSTNASKVLPYIENIPQCWIAAFNSPQSCTVAGTVDALKLFEQQIRAAQPKWMLRYLSVGNAYHTPLMRQIKDYYLNALTCLFNESPPVPANTLVASTVTGTWYDQPFTPQYCWDNVEKPVRFEEAIKEVLAKYNDALFIEVTPHPVLASALEECGAKNIISLMHKLKSEVSYFSEGLFNIEQICNIHLPKVNELRIKEQSHAKKHKNKNIVPQDIAIIGIGCRFPGGVKNKDDFWQLMMNGKSGITNVPQDRWNAEAFYYPHNISGKITNKHGGFIENVYDFDYSEFGISFSEAKAMDPCQRLLLEVCYEALEDAAIVFRNTNTGVFVGGESSDHIVMISGAPEYVTPYNITGLEAGITANRVSFTFDLKGPSLLTDTACAASLTALHLAMNSILIGDCDQAVVAGINLLLDPLTSASFSRLGVLSPTGACHVFDAKADGYVRSEGCGAVIIKPLSDAIKDGNNIYAVIHATEISSNGSNKSLTMPSSDAQYELFEEVLNRTQVTPDEIYYAELHGTGTPVGDPIEVTSAGKALCQKRHIQNPLKIGSVKSNIGHLEYAAGIAGLIKVALMMQYRHLVPTINFETPNPAINWNQFSIQVVSKVEPLPKKKQIYMTVSAYGFGGANAIALLSTYKQPPKKKSTRIESLEGSPSKAEDTLFIVGGLNRTGTEHLANLWKGVEIDPENASSMMITRAKAMEWHSYAVGHDVKNLVFTKPKYSSSKLRRPILFAIAGAGGYRPLLGHQLYNRFEVFRNTINELDVLLTEKQNSDSPIEISSLLEIGLFRDGALSRSPTVPEKALAIFFFQVAMIDLLNAFGIKPDAVLGISLGEITASYAVGELAKENIFNIRDHLIRKFENALKSPIKGGVLNIFAAPAEKNIFSNKAINVVQELMAGIPDLYISIDNDPTTMSVSGTDSALEKIAKKCIEKNIKYMRIDIGGAVHSPLAVNEPFEVVKEKLQEILKDSKVSPPKIPIISSYTGMLRSETINVDYLANMVFKKALIKQAFATVIKEFNNPIIIEIAPSSQMVAPITRCGLPNPWAVASEEHELQSFLTMLGELSLVNHWVRPEHLNKNTELNFHRAPSYPFDRKPCNMELPAKKAARLRPKQLQFAGNEFFVGPTINPWLLDHEVDGMVIFPGTGHVEIAIQHGFNAIRNLNISRPWIFSTEVQLAKFNQQGLSWSVQQGQTIYASGENMSLPPHPEAMHLDEIEARMTETGSVAEHYRIYAEQLSIKFGPYFQKITSIKKNKTEVLATISWDKKDYPDNILPPPIIDCSIQLMRGLSDNSYPAVLSKIERINYYNTLPEVFFSYIIKRKFTPKYAQADVYILDKDGVVCLSMEGVTATRYIPEKPPAPIYFVKQTEQCTLTDKINVPLKPIIFYYKQNPLALVEMCNAHDQTQPIALWIICEDTASSSAALGLGRCIINEYPLWQVKLIRITSSLKLEQRQLALQALAEGEWQSLPHELYLQEDGWTYPVLAYATNTLRETSSQNYFLDLAEGFGVENLRVTAKIQRQLKNDEIRIHVMATGVNFKDALIATGSIQLTESYLGLEIAGTVAEIGANVTRFKPGDRVFALCIEPGFSNQVITQEDLAGLIPNDIDFIEAASIPVVYLTTYFALVHQARIKQGDKILIHSGAGSIGQAAIQICIAHGCDIMVTVHGQEKQDYLYNTYSISRFADSHDLKDWSSKLRDWSPEGVQCVVNSLTKEAQVEGLRCLATEGCFIELGKRDFLEHTQLDLQHLFRNITFYSVHLDLFVKTNRRIFPILFKEVSGFVESPYYKSILNQVYPFQEVKNALTNMLNSQHVGKFVVSHYPEQTITQSRTPLFHPDKNYLLIGGCGALGLELVPWLVQEGANHITLTSRRAEIDSQQTYIIEWAKSQGINIYIKALDANNKQEMTAYFENMDLPLGGIFLLSAVFDDKPINKLNEESFAKVCNPKVAAVNILMELINPKEIEFLILFSSVASIFGNPGQGNYALANAYLDELIHVPYIRVVNLPGIMDVGQLQKNPQVLKKIESVGLKTCRSDYIGPLLKQLLIGTNKQIIALSANWNTLCNFLPSVKSSIPVEWIENSNNSEFSFDSSEEGLRVLLAQTFGIDAELIDNESPLVQYGLDSLNATSIAHKINQMNNTEITHLELLGGMTLAGLCKRIQSSEQEKTEKLPDGIVHLNSYEQGTPVFFLHDITGSVEVYRLLCAQLNAPCYGIYKHPSNPNADSIDELAEFYLKQIKLKQPEGPYRLVGWSAGGVFAWAIAHLLLKNKESVEQLILIDSVASIHSLLLPKVALKNMKKIDQEAIALSYLAKLTDYTIDQIDLYKSIIKIEGLTSRIQFVKTKHPIKILTAELETMVNNAAILSSLILKDKGLKTLDCQVDLYTASESQNIINKIHIPAKKLNHRVIRGNHWNLLTTGDLFTTIQLI